MAVCETLGISHSHFLGGPPAWTVLDRDKAVWFEIHKRETCPSCGTRADEWDPDRGGHDHAYVTELHKCWGCAEKAKADKRIPDDDRGVISVRMARNPEAR